MSPLAEAFRTTLLTGDRRLAEAAGAACQFEVFTPN